MKITNELTDAAVLEALGPRVERQRIEANLTQAMLAQESGVSKRTIERIEAGHGCELTVLIRVLRVLNLVEGFNALIPELPPSPIAQLKLQGRQRRRVARARRPHAQESRAQDNSSPETPTSPPPAGPGKSWTWGE